MGGDSVRRGTPLGGDPQFHLLNQPKPPHPWSQAKQWVIVTVILLAVAGPVYIAVGFGE